MVVWLAVRAREGGTNGAPATTAWLAEVTGLDVRTIRRAVAALVALGMLRRDDDKISTPSWADD